ncbi:MAG TPA: DNA repair protein RecO [Macromonas sp.]|nr:DNA repair protein RecO [Macromonas sp.]
MATASKQPRVHDEPAYVLHRHDWSESSLILEVFSRQYGRMAVVAKGVKRPTSQFRPVLLPLQPLRLGWGGDAEVRTLKSAHWQGGHVMPSGDALLAGCYLNELLLKLLQRDDPYPVLFEHYAQAVAALAQTQVPQTAVLRAFELLLLREAGYLPALDEEGASLQALQPQALYRLVPESGLQSVGHAQNSGTPGAQWQALQLALDSPEPFAALLQVLQSEVAERSALRQQLRTLLHYHSGVRVFQTRQLMVDAQRLGAR